MNDDYIKAMESTFHHILGLVANDQRFNALYAATTDMEATFGDDAWEGVAAVTRGLKFDTTDQLREVVDV